MFRDLVKKASNMTAAAMENLNTPEKDKNGDEKSLINTLIYENVLLQLQHLKTHPFVALHLSSGKTKLHGWVYDIKTGDVFAYDEDKQAFLPVAEKYAKEVLEFAKENTANCSH